jgi:hypothetical protein
VECFPSLFFQLFMYARRSYGRSSRSGRSYRRVTRPMRSGSRRTSSVKRAMGLKNRSRSLNTNPNQVYRVVCEHVSNIMITAGADESTTA